MAKEKFESRKLTGSINVKMDKHPTLSHWVADKAKVVTACISIVAKYMRDGFTLTLRQLYYQLVGGDIIPNNDKVYKKLGTIVTDCKMAGALDWSAIEDRGRVPKIPYCNTSTQQAVEDAVRTFRLDRQEGQDNIIEIWVEKDALSSILWRVARKYHIRLVINKGYSSSTAMYDAYQRFIEYYKQQKHVTILYFGDHDPSGKDMIRDIRERLTFMLCQGDYCRELELYDANELPVKYTEDELDSIKYSYLSKEEVLQERYRSDAYSYIFKEDDDEYGIIEKKLLVASNITVKSIALTMEQIEMYDLPPNPAKLDDPRSEACIEEFGNVSWEVDALSPQQIIEIVTDAVESEIDMEVFEERMEFEKEELEKLRNLVKNL